MMFGEEGKDDATFAAELAALIAKARKDGVPDNHLGEIVVKFYRRHGREVSLAVIDGISQ